MQTENLDLLENGRVILSSLEFKRIAAEGDRPQQFNHWQRCKGVRRGADCSVQAIEGSAVMYVEVQYEYQPLFGGLFAEGVIINREAAFTIRDDHNLAAGINNDLTRSTMAATCNKFDAT